MDMVAGLAIATIGNILICDDTNGFHDAANIVAMVVALRAITPVQAVIGVAVFEFPGPLLGGTAVANTIGSFIDESDLASVTGATLWNLGTCWIGLPSS
jgi:PiT family inorganic phosphate transporter